VEAGGEGRRRREEEEEEGGGALSTAVTTTAYEWLGEGAQSDQPCATTPLSLPSHDAATA